MPSRMRGALTRALRLLILCTPLAAAPAAAVEIDFDDLDSLTALSAADLGDVSVVDALVFSQADASTALGFDTSDWATSGDQGFVNTLAAEVVFDFATGATSFSVDIVGLPGESGDPTQVVLQAFDGAAPVAIDVSDTALIGDSGLHEDMLSVSAAAGFTRVVLFAGIPCPGDLCFEPGPTTSFFADSVAYQPVPEPGVALLLLGALALPALRARV